MKNHFKKLIGFVLTGTMIISTNIPTFAGQASSTEIDAVIEVLNVIEPSKDLYGLSDVNFEELEIGNAIQVYNYVDNEFVESRIMYPLVADGKLVAFAKELKDGNDVHFQISTSLADKISQYIDDDTEFSIVYDKIGCYIYYNGNFELLFEGLEQVEERSTIDKTIASHKNNELNISKISPAKALEYINDKDSDRAVNARYECPVSFVAQTNSHTCWAACIASVLNYLNGSNYTEHDIARYAFIWGYTDQLNQPLSGRVYARFMADEFNRNYEYLPDEPSDQIIIKNLKNDYPMIGGFDISNSTEGHSAVIFCIETVKGYLLLMDPGYDFVTAYYKPGGYKYTDNLNRELVLQRAVCYMPY